MAVLNYQTHIFHTAAVFGAGRDDIDSCGVYTAVTENIGKFCNILFNAIEYPCEQMAEIVRKDLLGIYSRFIAKCFHFPPDIGAAHRLTRSGYKNHTAFDVLLRCIAEQFFFAVLSR